MSGLDRFEVSRRDFLAAGGALSAALAPTANTADADITIPLSRSEHSMGTVTPGKVVGLVVLDANPLDDIRNSQKVHAVVTRGRLITSERHEKDFG